MTLAKSILSDIYNTVNDLQPENFLHSCPEVSCTSIETLKHLYDYTKDEEVQSGFINRICPIKRSNSKKSKKRSMGLSLTEAPLPQLITEDFEPAQIWEEIQLQNGLMYESLVSSISKLIAHANSLKEQIISPEEDDETQSKKHRRRKVPSYEEEEEEDSDEIEFEGNPKKKRQNVIDKSSSLFKKPKYSKSIVDDKFFNLAQMTEFLEKVESQIENEQNGQEDPATEENSDSEDSVDLFEDDEEEEESKLDKGENEKDDKIFYKDFFDQPLDENEREDENSEEKEIISDMDLEDEEDDDPSGSDVSDDEEVVSKKTVRFNLENMDEASSTSEDEIQQMNPNPEATKVTDEKSEEKNLSNFEKKWKKIEENIKLMEEEALQPKGWQHQGEITAERRPENSLLEEHLQFDHMLRQVPEVTAKITLKLEDIIKQRIKDLAWDDVERKAKPIETPVEYKNQLILSSEKSKQSLAQIYEQDYINKKKAGDGQNDVEIIPEEEATIQKDMRTLFAKLDALSNFHFTPKAPSADVKIVTNLPSIAMEEVAPVNVSDATLLAPQEIQAPVKGEIKAASERSSTDKKRERRSKKKKQHLKRIDREEKARLKGLGLRNVKLADNIIKKKSKGKDIANVEEFKNSKELKSSKAFFSKLQDTIQTQIKDKLKKNSKKDSKNNPIAKKFKL